MARGHKLSSAAEQELKELLGLEAVNLTQESVDHQLPGYKVIKKEPGAPLLLARDPQADTTPKTNVGMTLLQVESALGMYVEGAKHIDGIPRPSDYVATFKRLRGRAGTFFREFTSIGPYFRDQFKLHGADIYAMEAAVAAIVETSNKVLAQYEGQSSKGAPKNTALFEVIRRLRRIFRDNYRGPRTGGKTRGAFRSRGERERREIDFVRAALLDARIIAKGRQDIPRLVRDPRAALPGEHGRVLKQLARKNSRRQGREQKRSKC